MTWLFGVLDPRGIDVARVERAAEAMQVKGGLFLEQRSRLVMGIVVTDEREPGFASRGSDLLVADARVDAIGDAPSGSNLPAAAADALLDVLQTEGPIGLDDVAADFALAWWDAGRARLLLGRDATGTRPLYWGRAGPRVAFASDTGFLLALGIANGALEVPTTQRYLAGLDTDPRETGIAGIRRVVGGRWVSVTVDGPVEGGRWFRPERDPPVGLSYGRLVDRVESTVRMAVADRAQGERVGLWLSGGRDSGALAVALRREGMDAVCMTMTFDPAVCPSEDAQARSLAEANGHTWEALEQPSRIERSDVERLPAAFGIPLGMPFLGSADVGLRVARANTCSIVMEGTGGDAFAASPIASLDLLRAGHPRDALTAVRATRSRWVYDYPTQAKVIARGLTPTPMLRLRERLRRQPPWAIPGLTRGFDRLSAPRSNRDLLARLFLWLGGEGGAEATARLYRPWGITSTYPFRDRRVIRMLVGLPPAVLLPTATPKPLLTDAFLGTWDESRVKADQSEWLRAMARRAWQDFPDYYSASARVARGGLIRPEGVRIPVGATWEVHSLRLVPTEAWLRSGGDDGAA